MLFRSEQRQYVSDLNAFGAIPVIGDSPKSVIIRTNDKVKMNGCFCLKILYSTYG